MMADGIKDYFLADSHFKKLDLQDQINTLKHTLQELIDEFRKRDSITLDDIRDEVTKVIKFEMEMKSK